MPRYSIRLLLHYLEFETVNAIDHTKLPDAPEEGEIPQVTEIDELQTFVGNKKNKVWIWTVVNHWKPGILLWINGRSQ